MARTFTTASSEVISFTPRAFDTWAGVFLAAVGRRNAIGSFDSLYYAGSGSGDGTLQWGFNSGNDMYVGTNGSGGTQFAGTVSASNYFWGCAKATGTATPRADYSVAPFNASWVHSNMAATQANPATTAQTVEAVGAYLGSADFFGGDIEWMGVWAQGPTAGQAVGNQTESYVRLAPRFLPSMFIGCQRFYWFNQPISDTVRDMSNHMADQTARTGTTHTVNVPLMPNLAGTTFSVVPGVL
jgi:hypothetical protein